MKTNKLSVLSRYIFFSFLILFIPGNQHAQETFVDILKGQKNSDAIFRSPTISQNPASTKVVKLSLKEAVNYVIENNLSVKNAKFELVKADSLLLKNDSKFAWKASAGAEKFQTTLPANAVNTLPGTRQSNDKYSASIEKQFEIGTYFKLEASTVRFDSNAFESQSTSAALKPLAIPPLYTGAVGITLTQELLKNSFGKVERNTEKILGTQAAIQREEIIFQLSNLIVQVLVDYWSLSIADSAVKTYQKLLENTKNIRDLTRSKQRIGLAEKFETSQWDALASQVESQLEKAVLDRTEIKRKLLRVLNVDPSSEVTGLTDLNEEIPADLNMEKDLDFAYRMRIDLRNAIREREIADLQLKNAEFDERPSLKVSGSYSSRAQTLISPQENYYDT
ncbi:MAG: TolC family protein, partial [Leptospira sp.]|nr:TolC family protein [Leptospira sp.]